MMWMFDLFSVGTLTFVRTIETFVESLGHRFRMIYNCGSFLFLLVRMYMSCVHIIKLPNRLNNMSMLKKS
jgi:hypothetical protein